MTGSSLVLAVTSRTQALGTVAFTVDGTAVSGFPAAANPPDPDVALAGLPAQTFAGPLRTTLRGQHTITVTNAGGLGPDAAGAVAGAPLFDEGKLRDILLMVT